MIVVNRQDGMIEAVHFRRPMALLDGVWVPVDRIESVSRVRRKIAKRRAARREAMERFKARLRRLRE